MESFSGCSVTYLAMSFNTADNVTRSPVVNLLFPLVVFSKLSRIVLTNVYILFPDNSLAD